MTIESHMGPERKVTTFPLNAVKENLYTELAVSQELFDIVKEMGQIVRQNGGLAESTSESLRRLMSKTFNAAKSLSDGAEITGIAIRAYIDANRRKDAS